MDKPEFPPLLPDGLHRLTLSEIRALCVAQFPASTLRPTIMQGLAFVVGLMTKMGIVAELWIDGSFLTEKIDPDDVELSIRVHADFLAGCSAEQTGTLEWLSSDAPKDNHRCHTFPWIDYPQGHSLYAEAQQVRAYWLRQWGHSRTNEKKGIAALLVPEDAI